ncbi:hypothetical protein NQ315_010670 [Exocentrus adspersus]|uniref:CWH43-like N-terminal domain-containing protein n=1 Tax=Exocentrus adspersus TaxID=1586481 RepID=A0AAV8W5J4_9CUCU|nr:hypothetical protein NQ315_010670 [Exocentrus adspersus]
MTSVAFTKESRINGEGFNQNRCFYQWHQCKTSVRRRKKDIYYPSYGYHWSPDGASRVLYYNPNTYRSTYTYNNRNRKIRKNKVSFIVYIHYRQVRELCEKNEFKPYVRKLNTFSLYLGFIAASGIIVVACFQETNAFIVHMLGAGMCFGLGCVYHFLQYRYSTVILNSYEDSRVIISFAIYPTFGIKAVNIFRAICTVLYAVTLPLVGIFFLLSFHEFRGAYKSVN